MRPWAGVFERVAGGRDDGNLAIGVTHLNAPQGACGESGRSNESALIQRPPKMAKRVFDKPMESPYFSV